MKCLLAILALATVSACGPSFILLEIDAPLAIPSEANEVQVITLDSNDGSRELANIDMILEDGMAFPVVVLLEPSNDTPPSVRQRVTALLDGVAVAREDVVHEWESHRTNRATIELTLIEP